MILASFDFTNVLGILLFFAIGLAVGWWLWGRDGSRIADVLQKNDRLEREISAAESERRQGDAR